MAESFLLEIGCEEIPAAFIPPAMVELERLAVDGLASARIAHGPIRALATPRRLSILAEGVADRQQDRVREVLGPAVRVAFDAEGNPTGAAKGFAKGAGVAVDSLDRVATPKGEYVRARIHEKGQATPEVLAGLVSAWIDGIHFPKTMQWNGTGRFARPVRWIVALWGSSALAVRAFGVAAGRSTRGHRTIAPGPLEIGRPERYVAALRERGVLVQVDERRAAIERSLADAAAGLGGRAIQDSELLEEVTHLVEWPEAVTGSFDPRFLELPRPVVVTAMRAHQRDFAIERADGSLLPHFVSIRNGRGPGADEVRRGTEMVLRARLEDARFYWENDRRTGLEAKLEELKGILWHEKLGTLHQRSVRIARLAETLAEEIAPDSKAAVARAARLAKADLATEMIRSGKEFAALQGIVGAEYARAQGEPEDVAVAIREQYLPQGPSDPLPGTVGGTLLALADRLDSLVGGFRAGLEVTGSQDPYGLRRAGNGIIRILLEKRIQLDVLAAAARLGSIYDEEGIPDGRPEALREFWAQRMGSALADAGVRPDTAAAVLAVRPGSPLDLLARARALDGIRDSDDFEGLMIGYRRAANLLRSARPEDVVISRQPLAERAEAFGDRAEAELHLEAEMAGQATETLLRAPEPDYLAILRRLLGLKPSIDRFFEAVMVMVEDQQIRRARLSLLESVRQTFLRVADFGCLQSGPGQKSV